MRCGECKLFKDEAVDGYGVCEKSRTVRHRSIECVSPNVDGASCDGCQWADSDAMEADFICEDCMVCPHCGTRTGFFKKEGVLK